MSLTALLSFIRTVITVVISVTDLLSWDTAAVASTLKLVVRARYRVILITFVIFLIQNSFILIKAQLKSVKLITNKTID